MLINLITVFTSIAFPFALIFSENATVDESSTRKRRKLRVAANNACNGRKRKEKRKTLYFLKQTLGGRKNMRHAMFMDLVDDAHIYTASVCVYYFLLLFSSGQP